MVISKSPLCMMHRNTNNVVWGYCNDNILLLKGAKIFQILSLICWVFINNFILGLFGLLGFVNKCLQIVIWNTGPMFLFVCLFVYKTRNIIVHTIYLRCINTSTHEYRILAIINRKKATFNSQWHKETMDLWYRLNAWRAYHKYERTTCWQLYSWCWKVLLVSCCLVASQPEIVVPGFDWLSLRK